MDVDYFLRGLIIGLSIAAPVGPIGVLCIQRTITNGLLSGLVSGLGAATADGIYGFIAAFGLTFATGLLINQQIWLRIIGGLFLCYLGIRTFFTQPAEDLEEVKQGKGLFGDYGSTFILTLTNPLTILSFAAIFAGLGLADAYLGRSSAVLMVVGVFLGSATWWLLLSSGTNYFRRRFNRYALQWVNRVAGVIITAFGVVALFSLLLS
jgi:threonine/homoserine/homoserine lactone efflux protein